MLMLVAGLDKAYYRPRVYVVAETDRMSGSRALSREAEWQQQQQQPAAEAGSAKAAAGRAPPAGGDRSSSSNSSQGGSATVVEVIPRSREVGQSYATSVFTTLYSLLWAAWMVTRHRPQLVRFGGVQHEGPCAVVRQLLPCRQ
jgi:beta-1,4-N-acetylglucosaminyltransferase